MRSNVVSQAGLPTQISQWWAGIPFITSGVIVVCAVIYLMCLLAGYDSFHEVCFLPLKVLSSFQVYRIYTAVVFHGSLLHVFFNMLALVPLGSELERIMGSVRLLYMTFLLATTNAVFHLFIALLVTHNPVYSFPNVMSECAIGFSGILFAMIVIETSLSGAHSRSVFGLFNVPAKVYPWILLILFQFLASNVSLLGHLCGILSGFAYAYGLFNYLLPGPSFYSSIESYSILSACLRRPGFILCSGGIPYGPLPTHSTTNVTSSGSVSGNLWNNMSSWISQRETEPDQATQDARFPGRGRTLGSTQSQLTSAVNSDSSLGARLLDATIESPSETRPMNAGAPRVATENQVSGNFDEELKKLVSMGFEKTQAEVAVAAADGDLSVAIEILMSQQACVR